MSASNRDAIQDLKAAAINGEFQILLVFMFDRIGRIDDETPFVVEWFVRVGEMPDEEQLQKKYNKEMASSRAKQTKLNMELKRFNVQLEKLNDEIANSLTGDSVYSPEQLSSAINSVNGKITEAQLQLEIIENEMKNKKAALEAIKPTYERFVGWSAEFLAASNEHKKMIISQVISRIEIGKGYVINLELNVPYKRFCGQGSVDNVFDGVTVN